MELKLTCKEATIAPESYRRVNVELNDVDPSDVFNHFTLAEIIERLGMDEVLDHIGEEYVKEYFDLSPNN